MLALSLTCAALREAGADPVILNCESTDEVGKHPNQLGMLIDEQNRFVIYPYTNAVGELLKSRRPDGLIPNPNGDGFISFDMKMSLLSSNLIVANDTTGVIAITKHDGKFVYAGVVALPLGDGTFSAMAIERWGTCARSPFE